MEICSDSEMKNGDGIMIGFRVDANEVIATGHLMRCIAIARECMRRGEECLFFLAEEKETKRLEENGLNYRILHTDWRDMESEKKLLVSIIEVEKLDCLIVDSYQATGTYLTYLERFVPVLYIDDMEREIYSVSAVLRYSLWPEDTHFQQMYQETETALLVGMRYVPLREEFCIKQQEWEREKSIFITTGGTDSYNVAGKLLMECLSNIELKEYLFHVIVGSLNSFEGELARIAEREKRVYLHKDVNNMSDYMRKCELAVSAGGSTLFELCACQIPTVCFSFADNQKGFTKELEDRGVMFYAGDARNERLLVSVIVRHLCRLSKDSVLQKKLSVKMGELVDGRGTERIVNVIQNSYLERRKSFEEGIYLIEAESMDCKMLFEWANDSEVRKNSFQSNMISYEKHIKWFQEKMADADCEIFLCIADGKKVGQVRIEYKGRESRISYSVAKKYRGMGYGQKMLLMVEEKVAGKAEWLCGYVKPENMASQCIFAKLGYVNEWEGDHLVFRKHIILSGGEKEE